MQFLNKFHDKSFDCKFSLANDFVCHPKRGVFDNNAYGMK